MIMDITITNKLPSMKRIGVLTSGGDSQGMNSILFGLLKAAFGITDVYLIRDGYAGLLAGPCFIEKGNGQCVEKYLHQGGTIIGSSRCPEFRTVEGRRKAGHNLLKLDIHNLVVIGGDGTLTGANQLRQEWSSIVYEWAREKGSLELLKSRPHLNLVGIVGSIDNDFWGSEMTVGTDSALFRIVESIDNLKTTATSHHRAMIVEVMGRNCGYLALSSALATEATYVFLPECPHICANEWQAKLRARVTFEQLHSQRHHFVIVAEGACDHSGDPIKAESIRVFMTKELGIDSRVVCLGHTQRGGNTSAFDRLMSIQMGIEAFNLLRRQSTCEQQRQQQQSNEKESLVLTFNSGSIQAKPLMSCVQETTRLASWMKERKWCEVMALRGDHFCRTWNNFRELMSTSQNTEIDKIKQSSDIDDQQTCWLVVNIAAKPVPGMNAILYAVVRFACTHDIAVFACKNGLAGLIAAQFERFNWNTVSGLTACSGSIIGCGSSGLHNVDHQINDQIFHAILQHFERYRVCGLCVIGDDQALEFVQRFRIHRIRSFKVCYIPSTIELNQNKLFATHCKLGYDSILNKSFQLLSDLLLSNLGGEQRLFLVKLDLRTALHDFVQPSLFAMANSAAYSYSSSNCFQNGRHIDVAMIESDAKYLKELMLRNDDEVVQQNQLILIHKSYFSEIAKKYLTIFGSQPQVPITVIDLEQLQMPMKPSPFDRKLGVKLGMICAKYLTDKESSDSSPVLLSPAQLRLIPIANLFTELLAQH